MPYCDTVALAKAVMGWPTNDRQNAELDVQGIARDIVKEFPFDDYDFELAQRVMPTLKRISVIVPNYNYTGYLPERLKSIFDQNHPLFELIILDDNSSDDSVDVAEIAASAERRVQIIRNAENSGDRSLNGCGDCQTREANLSGSQRQTTCRNLHS